MGQHTMLHAPPGRLRCTYLPQAYLVLSPFLALCSPRVVHSAEIVAEALHPELAGLWGHAGATLLTLRQVLEPSTFTPPLHARAGGGDGSTGDGNICK